MSFKEDWNKGTKFENHFNKLARKAYPLVGELSDCLATFVINLGHPWHKIPLGLTRDSV